MLLFTTSSRHLCRRRSKSIRLFSSNTSSQNDFRPKRIILLRHGQSLGNVDESAYVTTADWRIPLTDLGKDQARGKFGDISYEYIYYDIYLVSNTS